MQSPIRVLVVASVWVGSSPLLAQDFSETGLKAFTAKIDAAVARCDIDTIIDHIAELAIMSGTAYPQGQMRMFRMNKTQYRQMLTATCGAATSYRYQRTNEKISIEGDQATITADVAETMVIDGREVSTKARERATVENIDGKLMLTQLVAHQIP
jgi:hypothetical protein